MNLVLLKELKHNFTNKGGQDICFLLIKRHNNTHSGTGHEDLKVLDLKDPLMRISDLVETSESLGQDIKC